MGRACFPKYLESNAADRVLGHTISKRCKHTGRLHLRREDASIGPRQLRLLRFASADVGVINRIGLRSLSYTPPWLYTLDRVALVVLDNVGKHACSFQSCRNYHGGRYPCALSCACRIRLVGLRLLPHIGTGSKFSFTLSCV